jgi:predicted RNA binding protein YcfA (HicA-like mRNA interferase family)
LDGTENQQIEGGCPAAAGWLAGSFRGSHDVFKHPMKPGRIVVPRHRGLSPGVARVIAGMAGWKMT